MTLAKKGLRTIQVNGEQFIWKIRQKTSHEERPGAQLGIPIQYVDGGQLLVAYVGYSRSHSYYGTCRIREITPLLIESAITDAIRLGWRYRAPGKPVSVLNGALVENTRNARPPAEAEPLSDTTAP